MKWLLRAQNMCNLLIMVCACVGFIIVFFPDETRSDSYRSVIESMAFLVVPWMAAIFGGKFVDSKGTKLVGNQQGSSDPAA